MSDSSDQDKTEEPSARRIQKSREEGQVARSRELSSALLLFAASFSLKLVITPYAEAISHVMASSLSLTPAQIMDNGSMMTAVINSLLTILPLSFILLFVLMLAGALGQVLVGGWIFHGASTAPKFSRINPLQWPEKVFSKKGAMELLKSILKIILMLGCLAWLVWHYYPQLLILSRMPLKTALATGLDIMSTSLFAFAMIMVVISAVDAPFQIWSHHQQLKMTRQEVKDEHKEMEGSPEVKQKVRQIQREMANQRMMKQVPEADVIITNPTHYSVALKYDTERSSAPFVIAKGVDQIAIHIRDIARGNDIRIVEAPLLTRAVYHSTRIDQEIPADLYLAVAQVLAYVHQLNQFGKGELTARPLQPDLDIPEGYDRHRQE